MRHRIRHMFALGAVAAMATLAAPSARADFEINIFSGSTLIFQAIDNVVEDDDSTVGEIGLSGAALSDLNSALLGAGLLLRFNNLSATSNSGTSLPFANLTVNGQVAGTGGITIDVSANDYTSPSVSPVLVDSSSSMTFTSAAGSTGDFTSYYNPNDMQNSRTSATGTLFFATLSPGVDSPKGILVGPDPLIINSPTNPFALENVTNLNLNGDLRTKIGFSGTTLVRPVPEPTSMALLLFGGSALAVRAVRRRKPLA